MREFKGMTGTLEIQSHENRQVNLSRTHLFENSDRGYCVYIEQMVRAAATGELEMNAHLFSAAKELLEYAMLEAEYSRLCDRRREDYSPEDLMSWIESNGIQGEPVGAWLGRKRTVAISKALGICATVNNAVSPDFPEKSQLQDNA